MNEKDITSVAERVRAFLEPYWIAWFEERGRSIPEVPSQGMCRFSALFLAKVLQEELGGTWKIRGGTSDPMDFPEVIAKIGFPGGLRSPQGDCWHDHYWVVDSKEEWLVDVTADQFGYEPVVVTQEHGIYRGNFRQAAVRDHLVHVEARVNRWFSDWMDSTLVMHP